MSYFHFCCKAGFGRFYCVALRKWMKESSRIEVFFKNFFLLIKNFNLFTEAWGNLQVYFWHLFFFLIDIYLFIGYAGSLLLLGLSLVAVSKGYSLVAMHRLSFLWLLLLQSTGSRARASVVVAHGLGCSSACGIFLDQGLNQCPPRCKADS